MNKKQLSERDICTKYITPALEQAGCEVRFAKDVVPTLDPACFEIFRPMFEYIKSKCPAEAKGGDVTP